MSNIHDTMLAHHTFAGHLKQSLAQVVSEYADAAPWKILAKDGKDPTKLSGEKLVSYNASDVRLTYLAWQRMQLDLAPERHVYEHDRALSRICIAMGQAGIGVDHARKAELEGLLATRREELKALLIAELGRDFNPASPAQCRTALFGDFEARPLSHTDGGAPQTNDELLESLAKNRETPLGRFARNLLQWRLVGKILSTYLRACPINVDSGRAHYSWKAMTETGRMQCRLQSVPRYSPAAPEKRVREIYVPRAGTVFVYFDVSQAEPRLAAYMSADPAFIAAVALDFHTANARVVFPEQAAQGYFDGAALKDPERGKKYRDICKNFGLAINYGAGADKLHQTLVRKGFPITLRQCEAILRKLRKAYPAYFAWANANVARVRREGYMRSPLLGRIRWLGWSPNPNECFNYPIQSACADVMNARTIALSSRLPPACHISAQIHDSLIIDCPRGDATLVEALIRELWAEPIALAGGALTLPIDLKRGESWAEL